MADNRVQFDNYKSDTMKHDPTKPESPNYERKDRFIWTDRDQITIIRTPRPVPLKKRTINGEINLELKMATKHPDLHGRNKLWPEPVHKVENGVWVLENNQVGRNEDPIFDLEKLKLGENKNRAWIVTTKLGGVLVETWKRSGNSPAYIEYHIWIGEYRYWRRTKDEYRDDSERIKSANDFGRLVTAAIARFQKNK